MHKQTFASCYFMKTLLPHLYCLTPPFSNFVNPLPLLLFLLPGFFWSLSVIFFNDIMDLSLLCLGTFVPAAPCVICFLPSSKRDILYDTSFSVSFFLFDLFYSCSEFGSSLMNVPWDLYSHQSCSADEHYMHLGLSCWFDILYSTW